MGDPDRAIVVIGLLLRPHWDWRPRLAGGRRRIARRTAATAADHGGHGGHRWKTGRVTGMATVMGTDRAGHGHRHGRI